jgi:DNA-binding phage protein
MLALRRMAKAFGGVQNLQENLNANTLYRTLSPKGNPELKQQCDSYNIWPIDQAHMATH